jgi:predicted nuclease with RNAse H fold
LYGLKNDKLYTNLIEVYPGAAWPVIAGHRLPKKRLLAGRQSRYAILLKKGIKFSPDYTVEAPPTHDQLDAAMAAYTAYLFTIGKTIAYGQNPFEDERLHILREGLIVHPAHI